MKNGVGISFKGIDQNKALNRAIWSLTEKMAELKGESLAA
ncbi:hypothetical protein RKLH11_3864 [Rhodobacteraceae bacterium KLH11]|nr:hypothetical protein RKLH11_3864 [Rhodobacteraceae bacterium KLH11]